MDALPKKYRSNGELKILVNKVYTTYRMLTLMYRFDEYIHWYSYGTRAV